MGYIEYIAWTFWERPQGAEPASLACFRRFCLGVSHSVISFLDEKMWWAMGIAHSRRVSGWWWSVSGGFGVASSRRGFGVGDADRAIPIAFPSSPS